jgi:hypothetical protein
VGISRLMLRAFLVWPMLLLATNGCDSIPKDALTMSPETIEHRQLQTRRFDGTDEKTILAASAGVLQDLGFNLDESEVDLGVIVASKERSAISAAQVTGAVVAALFGAYTAIDKTQKVRVSLVVRPAGNDISAHDAKDFFVRATFQRIIWNTQGQITKIEAVDDAQIYQEFFDKLSKSLFLTANQI